MFKKGLTGYQLKIWGLVFMVCDHIHQMFYYAGDLKFLSILGRLALPIFLFTCAEGYSHTRSKTAYAIRLGAWSIGMRLCSIFVLHQFFPIEAHSVELMNNIFATLAVSVVVMMALDALYAKRLGRALAYLALPALPLLAVLPLMALEQWDLARIFALLPSYLSAEGGPFAILMAVLFYALRKQGRARCLVVLAFGLLNIVLGGQFSLAVLWTGNPQWWMMFSLPFLLLYNGQKGGGSKYFFYIFYPAHIYALYLLAYFLLEKGILS